MTRKNKTQALIFLSLALGATLLLASGLSTLSFEPGIQFSLRRELERLLSAGFPSWTLWILLILLLVAFTTLRRQPGKKGKSSRGAGALLRVLIILFSLGWLYAFSRIAPPGVPDGQAQVQEPVKASPSDLLEEEDEELISDAAQVFEPVTPAWGFLAISLLLAALSALLVALLFFYYRGRMALGLSPLDRLGEEAREAVAALESGADINDVILRSYYQMGRILEEERGIQRGAAMTPEEFEVSLVRLGFPKEPVHSLTWLFEQVRYGAQWLGESEQRQALNSLGAIAAYCQETGSSV